MGFGLRYIPFFIGLIILTLTSCAPKVTYKEKPEGKLSVDKCNQEVVNTEVYFCNAEYAYSNRFQHMSKIRIVDPSTGKSITIGVRYLEGVEGLCLPSKYKEIFKKDSFIGKVYLLRCGENDVRYCPIKLSGLASWYGEEFAARKTASENVFNHYEHRAAHRYLPFGTLLEVKNLKNGRKVVVEVVDRGPFVDGRELDLSYGAAKELDMIRDGVIPFEARVLRCGK